MIGMSQLFFIIGLCCFFFLPTEIPSVIFWLASFILVAMHLSEDN